MLTIVQHTPLWVWALLAVLIPLGVLQSVHRKRKLGAAMAMPIGLTAVSLFGAASGFANKQAALAAWLAGAAVVLVVCVVVGAWRRIEWSATEQRLDVPVSWWPMALILALFATKYVVGVSLAIHPQLAADAVLGAQLGFVYGAFSGVFLSRALAMWRVAAGAIRGTALERS
jgi:hypothetical protein